MMPVMTPLCWAIAAMCGVLLALVVAAVLWAVGASALTWWLCIGVAWALGSGLTAWILYVWIEDAM